jgi:signal transduction histidine kinase/predicted RNA-binding protein with RPS1 domain
MFAERRWVYYCNGEHVEHTAFGEGSAVDKMDRKRHAIGEVVVGTVEQVHPFGVFVRLADGSKGYIRRRQLSLSGDLDPRVVVKEGDQIKVVVVELAEPGKSLDLSRKATLPDPLREFISRFREGDVVGGTVKNLRPYGVFVEVMPGVEGLVLLEELASWKVEKPEDVVWEGDHVEVVITRLDSTKRKVRLSIRQRLEHLARVEAIMEGLHRKTERSLTPEAEPEEESTTLEADEERKIVPTGPVLVVEDHDAVREPLVKWLSDQGCPARGAATVAEAMKCYQKDGYGLVLVDLDLPEVDGLSFIRQLRRSGVGVPVAVMSGPELIAEQLPALRALEVAAVFPKPLDLDEIRRFLLQLARGEKPTLSLETGGQATAVEAQPFQKLAGAMRSSQPLAERFRQGLEHLIRETRAEVGIIFRLDRISGEVSLVAHTGNIPLKREAIYALVDSPVKDVIVEGKLTWESRVSQERTGRFRKLQELLPFESCIGVPLQASGQTDHALFLFHRDPDVFSHYPLRDALAMATLFAVALEIQALDERVQSLSRIFLSGQLAAGFGHEVYNKLSGLDLQFRNVRSDFDRLARDHFGLSESFDFQQVRRALDKAVEMAVDLKRMVEGFRRLMVTKEEQVVDVNQVIRQAEVLVRPLARRANVKMRLELAPNLPPALGSNNIGLYQVFLNLMLNAIQQMEKSPDALRALVVSTAYEAQDDTRPAKVRFSDTGPGIHRQLWDKIFALGFTTRPGASGLGLFIARSLVESMGGRIAVEESLVPLGTTFLVELPTAGEMKCEE